MPGALFGKESSLYISLLSRDSKLLANLIAKTEHGRKYYHSRFSTEIRAGEISMADKRNKIKKYRERYLFGLTPFFLEDQTCEALHIGNLNSNIIKIIDSYDLYENIFVKMLKKIDKNYILL